MGPKRPSVGVYVCVGGGGIPLPHGREIFEIICIQIAFFGTLKDLLLDPFHFCLVSPIKGAHGLLYPPN